MAFRCRGAGAVHTIRVGRENRPPGGHYCARIYTSLQTAETLDQSNEPIEPGPTPLFDAVIGLVMLSQTCDIVRRCQTRPFVEVAPLIAVEATMLEEIRRLKRPGFAYVPAVADKLLVADLDRTMTIEKALVLGWNRISGCSNDTEHRAFSHALSRKRSRFAFPDEFQQATVDFQERMVRKTPKQSEEGAHIRALSEIRVRAAPSWDAEVVYLTFWFIKENDPPGAETVDWSKWADQWLKLIHTQPRFHLDPPTVVRLEDITARDYLDSDRLDFDSLSIAKKT